MTSFEYKEDADIVCSNDVQLVWVAFNEEHELIPVTNQHELVFFEKCKMLWFRVSVKMDLANVYAFKSTLEMHKGAPV